MSKKKEKEKHQETAEKRTQEVSEKKEAEITYFKGYVMTGEKIAPQYKSYDSGNTTLTFTMGRKDPSTQQWEYKNVYAKNEVADRLYATIMNNETAITVKGAQIQKENANDFIVAQDFQKHKILSIDAEILKVQTNEKNKDFKDLFVVHRRENGEDTYNISVHKDIPLNEAKLKKGETIAVNGESTTYQGKDNTRNTYIKAWNVAPSLEKLHEIVEGKKKATSMEVS